MSKKIKILIISVLSIIMIVMYILSFDIFGNKEKTETSQEISTTFKERARLEDDFYDYINYDYLSENKLEEEFTDSLMYNTETIDKEKEVIIKELLSQNNAISKKMNTLYDLYMHNTEKDNLNELNKYIEKIKDSQNIQEFFKNAIDINYELSTDILVSPNVLFNIKGESKKYFGLDQITYDWDNTVGYYSLDDYEEIVRMYKKYNIQLLKKYGYSAEEAIKITDEIQEMYQNISRFSEIDENKLFENGYKVYSISELQSNLKNIDLKYITSYYSEFYNSRDGILVVDINQLKQIDSYLKDENLETLKNYAILKILTEYSKYISMDYYNIYESYVYENQHSRKEKDYTAEEIAYFQIYYFFKDTVTEEFSNRHFTKEQKTFYANLIKDEIEIYIKRLLNEEWLSNETKNKAIAKMENMSYTVGTPDKFVKVENKYTLDDRKTYIANIVNMRKRLKREEMIQYMKGNLMYNNDMLDQLTMNACYLPNNNSINLLLGYIYSATETFDLGYTNLNDNYYKILGAVGATIGHELSHALDTMGSKYDENGNYINWWSDEDAFNFNTRTSKVVRYYDKYEQYGSTTIGENIADIGGMTVVLEVAKNNNATTNDYKTLFETYAKAWASQQTSIYREFLLKNDEHSPDKNRVNAVLSSMDKFYEVYNIKETDKMYVPKENRVSVW